MLKTITTCTAFTAASSSLEDSLSLTRAPPASMSSNNIQVVQLFLHSSLYIVFLFQFLNYRACKLLDYKNAQHPHLFFFFERFISSTFPLYRATFYSSSSLWSSSFWRVQPFLQRPPVTTSTILDMESTTMGFCVTTTATIVWSRSTLLNTDPTEAFVQHYHDIRREEQEPLSMQDMSLLRHTIPRFIENGCTYISKSISMAKCQKTFQTCSVLHQKFWIKHRELFFYYLPPMLESILLLCPFSRLQSVLKTADSVNQNLS